MEGLTFFYLAAINIIGGGIYLRFDHKHFHNKKISCCLPFKALWSQAPSQ
jgi:hypothetical protein